MSRLRSSIVALLFFGACRALPSRTPLADIGLGRPGEDGALGRNRVASSERKADKSASDDDTGADETITIVAGAVDAGDAGPPEGGLASADAGDAGGRWAGEYFGSDRHTKRIEGAKEDVELDDKAHTRVEEPSPGIARFSLVSSATGEVICGVRARVTGDRAELEPGESCGPLDLKPPLVLSGSAKLEGEALELDLEGHGDIPMGDDSVEVDVEYHFEGKRR